MELVGSPHAPAWTSIRCELKAPLARGSAPRRASAPRARARRRSARSTRRAALRHQRDDVGRARGAGVLDEVGVLGREARAADRQAVAAGLGQQQPRRATSRARLGVVRVLEGRAERLDPLRLGLVAASAQLRQASPSRSRGQPRSSANARPHDDLAGRRGPSGGSRTRAAPGARRSRPVGGRDHRPTRASARARRRRRSRSSAPRRRRSRGC